ncbi:MAG TPA: AsmA-like C-terminal region-containing protein [Puia sp.]
MKSKILKITGVALLVLIVFVWAAPFLFKGKIISLIRSAVNKDLRADVDFSDLDISWLRHFPNITVGLENLEVTCVGEFQGDTLMSAKQFNITSDIRSFVSGDSIKIYSVTAIEPRFHALIHKDGHSNWNIIKSDSSLKENIGSSTRSFKLELQRYGIHKGYLEYLDESKDIHVEMFNLEHDGMGDFTSDLFTLKTRTTADAVNFNLKGAIPYRVTAKTSIDLAFRVDNKTHTYSFNTDQVSFNDLKLHTEGFFQWINDSSYSMNIHFKAPSTKFKNILSMLPSVYQKDFASIESNGQVNFNGFIKGKYDKKHFPAYHTNLYVQNGFFKYPDLLIPVENIHLGLQVDNPDGIADHMTINISEAHAEINHDTVDMHLLVKNLETKPYIDFAFAGKLDLANISQWMKLEPGTKWSGLLIADIHAKGNIPETEKQKKGLFQSWGDFDLSDFLYSSKAYPGGIALNELIMTFNSKNVLIQELKGAYLTTHVDVTGSLNNLFDFALRNKPLKASIDLKADALNLREWIRTDKDTSATSVHVNTPFLVPDNIDFTIHAEADKLHYDNLDLQNLSCKLVISDETVQMIHVKANGLDGDITMDGTYSTLESKENPEIALTYDVKGLDIQKTFFGFNTVRRIMPVAKFIAGNLNAHMSLNGRLHDDMIPDLQTLNGEGNVQLLAGSMKDFGPLDKLSQSLDIAELKDIPLKDIKADFTFKNGKVVISPFIVHTNDIEMEIGGTHGFDQSLDYGINLKVPRSQLGSKGNLFVKNVVTQAADKGIPVKLKDAVNMNVKMSGTINSPDVKENMDSVIDLAATDLKKEVNDFVNAKLDSARQQLRKPSAPAKKQLFVQTSYKSKTNLKAKKTSGSAHKNATHTKTKKKHKKSSKNYSTSLKKEKRTVSNSSGKREGL